ncbi:MAG TPA: HD domain-containing phosphohydrolase [Nitrospiria bacterium]|nr:HD domain-containing phosphohydrolase [Nitrospiria bacterium]
MADPTSSPPAIAPHRDVLEELNKSAPLSEKLRYTHSVLKQRHDFLDRIAVAVHDSQTDLLKTFIYSGGPDTMLSNYECPLGQAGSLREIVQTGQPRVVNDLSIFAAGRHEHTRRIAAGGFGSSYTMPMYLNGIFFGFVFFNSYRTGCFRPEVMHDLDLFGHLVSLMVIGGLTTFRTMLATLRAARNITSSRDLETGAHLDRMAHYARLIAVALAESHRFDDEFIEHIFLFSPLHDIGKIGVPDHILRKPSRLTPEEFEIMKSHVAKGRQIIDAILQDFGLDSIRHAEIMRNIASYHHEAVDGTGYPNGLSGASIPIEARIIAVADIFDALTSRRPYKSSWSNDEALAMLRELAGLKLDPECVEALIRNRAAIETIQAQFKEEVFS